MLQDMLSHKHFLITLPIIGIIFTTGVQLRLTPYPVGPGELVLIVWLLCLAWPLREQTITRPSLWFSGYFALSYVFLSLGWLTALSVGLWPITSSIHIGLALVFTSVIAIAFFITSERYPPIGTLRLFWWLLVILISCLFICSLLTPRIAGIELFFLSSRFIGWTVNPNQMGLILSPLPFLGIGLARYSASNLKRSLYLLFIVLILCVGVATVSDALFIAWACALPLIFLPERATISTYRLIILATLSITVILLAFIYYNAIIAFLIDIWTLGDQGSIRISLALNALYAITDYPLTGLGPGAYSGIHAPYAGSEAHNTLIDIGSNMGMVILLITLSAFVFLLTKTIITKQYWLSAALLALFIYSLFHLVNRHPIFWCYLALIIHITFTPTNAIARKCRQTVNNSKPTTAPTAEKTQRLNPHD